MDSERALEPDEFLAWALKRLHLCWAGFRKVRKQVHKRIGRRVSGLGLDGLATYRRFLDSHPEEWAVLDSLCRITISRFYRGRGAFRRLQREVLPELAACVRERGDRTLWCWSAGCASGEEPYSLRILWDLGPGRCFPDLALRVVATDTDPVLLKRAREATYPPSSLREVPSRWKAEAFFQRGGRFLLKPGFTEGIEVRAQDIRSEVPRERFDLVLCRNLVFTYFAEGLQAEVLGNIVNRLRPGGFLLLGEHEALPRSREGLLPQPGPGGFYRKAGPG
jgi:chemotaxis protein methyltransferase CheR